MAIERAGFEYVLRRTNKNGTRYWRCLQSKQYKCPSHLSTSGSPKPDEPLAILEESSHSHAPKDSATCEINKSIQESLETAQNYIEKPIATICDETTERIQRIRHRPR